MLTKLLILGTGPHALEMVDIVSRVNRVTPTWELVGLVSPPPASSSGQPGYPVIGGPEMLAEHPDTLAVPEFGWPRELLPPRERLASLIDPGATIARTARLGEGCVIYPGVFVGANARVGDLVFCLSGSAINHDDVIEDRVSLATGAAVAGEVHVETECYLGQGCMIRQKLRIGRDSVIGMGAVVIRDVMPNSVMVGNPARRLRRPNAG